MPDPAVRAAASGGGAVSGTVRCPGCGALLVDVGGPAACGLCGAIAGSVAPTRAPPEPITTVPAMMARREALMPTLEALMQRYIAAMEAAAFGRGTREEALRIFEVASYVTHAMAFEVDDLDALEERVTPLMPEAARQLGCVYRPPHERGEAVTWALVDAILAG